MLTEAITPKSWLKAPRPHTVQGVIIHATRGNTSSSGWEYIATKNWFQNPNNSGSCANCIIGPNGEMCVVMRDNEMPQWSAGWGGIGPPTEFAIDHYFKSYEIAQPNNSTPFTDLQYERLAIEVAKDMEKYGFPAIMQDFRGDQTTVRPGVTRHDRTANGVKLGKTDPGIMWNDVRFIDLLRSKTGEVEMQLISPVGRNEVYACDGATNEHIPTAALAKAVYGTNWSSKVVSVASNDARLKLPTLFPKGVPSDLL